MKKLHTFIIVLLVSICFNPVTAQVKQGQNPIIFADVPDVSMPSQGNLLKLRVFHCHIKPFF